MRLGLIALSGVRVHDPELVAVGLTLPGFVERGRTIASLPSLGLLTLAGMTPAALDVEYVEVPDLSEVDGLPGQFDAVAISALSARARDAYALADRYRAAGTLVILGGLHATALPEEAAPHADAVVAGEGEPVWQQVVGDLLRGRLQPLYDARATPFDLRQAPLPRFELLDAERYDRVTVQTQRGCPYDCEFCAASIRLSPAFRVKPVERVLAEVRRIRELWPHPFLELADDNTFADRRHGKRLLRALAGEGLRWFTETDVSVSDDDELLGLMRDSGCAQVLIGLESPSRAGLAGLERRSDFKARRVERNAAAIARIQRRGISVNGCFVLGLDGTGPESFDAVLEFVEATGLHEVQVTLLTPFPGTPLYERLEREGRLLHPGEWQRRTLFDVCFRPDGMTAEELRTGFRGLVQRLYAEPAVARRRRRFREELRAARDGPFAARRRRHEHTSG